MTTDKATIATELYTAHQIKFMVQGSGGFAGSVALAASLVDNAGAALTGWTVALDNSTLTVAANGSAEATATLTIPSATAVLAGNVKLVATSGSLTQTATSAVTVANQITFNVTQTNNVCDYKDDLGTVTTPVDVIIGTKIRFLNASTNVMIIHSQSNGIPHQNDNAASGPNQAYEATLGEPVGPYQWYCHNQPTPASADRPTIRVVAQ